LRDIVSAGFYLYCYQNDIIWLFTDPAPKDQRLRFVRRRWFTTKL